MKSDYGLLLDPALGIDSADLAAAWAEIPECTETGPCELRKSGRKSFGIDYSDAGFVLFVSIAGPLAKDLILELVKRAITRAEERKKAKALKEPTVEWVNDPQTGVPVIRVTRKP